MDVLTQAFDFLSSLTRRSEDGLVVWWRYEGDYAGLTFPQCEGKRWLEMPSRSHRLHDRYSMARKSSNHAMQRTARTVRMLSFHYYAKATCSLRVGKK